MKSKLKLFIIFFLLFSVVSCTGSQQESTTGDDSPREEIIKDEDIEDTKVAYSFIVDSKESFEITVNKSYEIVTLEGISENAKKARENVALKRTNFNVAVNQVLSKILEENDNILLTFDTNCSDKFINKVNNYFKAVYKGIVASVYIPVEDQINKEIEEYSANKNISYGYAQLIYSLHKNYPSIGFENVEKLSFTELMNLLKNSHLSTYKAFSISTEVIVINNNKEIEDTKKYLKDNYQIEMVNDEDLMINSYVYNSIKNTSIGYINNADYFFLHYTNGIRDFEKHILLEEKQNIETIYDDFTKIYNNTVEAFVDSVASTKLGNLFASYRDYIYDYVTVNNRKLVTSLSIKEDGTYYAYTNDQTGLKSEEIKFYLVNTYQITKQTKYYITMMVDKNDNLIISYGNALTCLVMKAFINNDPLELHFDCIDLGFSMSDISDKTGRGKY